MLKIELYKSGPKFRIRGQMVRSARNKFSGNPAVCSADPFDIASLESEVLTRLFNETTTSLQKIRIEVVTISH